ncbi:MAG: hypothetical protein GY749_27430 [Desulfobacteraceae bacterium]|nr:hypothetical protein [Desulfobacteraceae bacterium]
MKVINTKRPGDPGTKKLLKKYGDRLVAVRWYTDSDGNKIKTIELKEEEKK